MAKWLGKLRDWIVCFWFHRCPGCWSLQELKWMCLTCDGYTHDERKRRAGVWVCKYWWVLYSNPPVKEQPDDN